MTRLKTFLLLLAGSLALSGCSFDVYKLPLPGGADTGDDPLTVTVMFRDVLDLVPQSTVKVNDVSVGKVTDVTLEGYVAKVEVELRNDTELPDNAVAEIRQTSLLGEKFVSLKAPETRPSAEMLGNGDVIPLESSGRNPEIEEVLGALSLLLNGGGVAQLKTIASELNLALEGREGSARSVLTQLNELVGQLDDNKGDIVRAIEALNRLAISVNGHQDTIDLALDELPSAVRSLNRQRDDLVKMLAALNRLSSVGVRVISASKESTIDAFRSLRPVLKSLADAGSDLPFSLQTLLTYPFVDESVGRDPQVARNLHMGDYTNLSVQLDLDLSDILANPPGLPVTECIRLGEIPDTGPLPPLADLCEGALAAVQNCFQKQTVEACAGLPGAVISEVCDGLNLPLLCGGATGGGGGGGGGLPGLPGIPGLPDLGLGRAAVGPVDPDRGPTVAQMMQVYDPALVNLLLPGMVVK
jgi:phospholipid/cholesterol/gamma-HCH transport system substrate-binding protein